MASLVKQAMKLIIGDDPRKMLKRPLKPLTDRQLIKLESEIGRTLFGEIPAGHTREFFCLDAETWVWYEQWQDKYGKDVNHTIRYEVHPNGVLKVQDSGANYSFLSGQELENLALATQAYKERVMRQIYKRDPETGKLLTVAPGIILPK
jgi:hypothetical protein